MSGPSDRDSKSREATPFHIQSISLPQEILMMLTICSAQGLVQAALAQSIIADNVINDNFHGAETDLTWFPAAYALTSGTFMIIAGRAGDIIGHKIVFVASWIWFTLWSLLAGLSVYTKSIIFFDVCRAFQGTAAASLVPTALAMLGLVYREGPRKNLAFSLYASASPIGFTLGCVFGALLAQLASWPWMFYVTAIFSCVLAVCAGIALPSIPQQSQGPPRFDWLGSFTGVGGLVLFNFAWNRAPAKGWTSPQCIAPLVIGVVLIVAFILAERNTRRSPLIPITTMSRGAWTILVVIFLAWSSFGILIFYSMNFITQLRGDTMLSLAAQFIPVIFTGLAASLLATFLLGRGIRPPWILAFALLWFVTPLIILATMPIHQSYWLEFFWVLIIAPFGMDLSFTAGTILLSNLVPKEHQGIAAALIATVVYYSQSLGLGIAGTVESHVESGSQLKSYRGAWYLGIGLSGLGLSLAVLYAVVTSRSIRNFLARKVQHKEMSCVRET